jgi:hypothetical protein
MMSAHRDSRRRLLALTYPAISAKTAALCRLLDGQCPLFLVLDIATRQWPCLPSFEGR